MVILVASQLLRLFPMSVVAVSGTDGVTVHTCQYERASLANV